MDETCDAPAINAGSGEPHGGQGRRGLLKCMVWAGTGVLWTVSGGVPQSRLIASAEAATPGVAASTAGELSFMQISDSHIGFANAPNTDTPGTLREAVGLVTRQKANAAFMLHTGDVSQLSKPVQFDTAEQIIREAGLDVHYVPGEHDVLVDGGRAFFVLLQHAHRQDRRCASAGSRRSGDCRLVRGFGQDATGG